MSAHFDMIRLFTTPQLMSTDYLQPHERYRFEFFENVLQFILNDAATYQIQKDYIEDIKTFVGSLKNCGKGSIKDSHSKCYPILMIIQCAIESFLTRELYAQHIGHVHALVLAQEATPPQLKNAPVKSLMFEKYDHPREQAFDPREITLPYLCEAGAVIQWAYSTKFQNHQDQEKTLKIQDEKKEQGQILKIPLKKDIPFDLTGTLYRFEGWVIVIHGNSEPHKNSNDRTWKIWMVPDHMNSEGLDHAHAMEQFVLKNKSDK